MSSLLQFSPGLVRRQQVFTSSGTFTPSARLLALGGWVEVLCVGGGGGGYISGNLRYGGGGGNVARSIVQVTGPVTVTVGAGGTGGSNPTFGGNSSFGSLVVAQGGHAANQWEGGSSDWYSYASSPGGGGAGGLSPTVIYGTRVGFGAPGVDIYGHGGAGVSNSDWYWIPATNAPANTGQGGHAGGNGGSGIVIVEWWE